MRIPNKPLLLAAAIGLALVGSGLAGIDFSQIAVRSSARAQAIPKSLEPSGNENAVRLRKNNAVVGVAGGLLSGTYMKFADELAQVLDDGDKLRVLPIVTYGAASNLEDLLYLRGVDVAITQSDVFEYFRTQRKIANLEKRVNYIIRLPVSEMHVLARNEIKTIEDLRGKKVNFGPAGSASSLTGTIVFQRLGVQVDQVLLDNPTAMQKLKSGEISALVRVIGKPIDVFEKMPPNSGLHFVSIPFSKPFADYYTVGELTRQDYPTLVTDTDRVDTIAVPAVLAVYNWPKGSDRYERVHKFVEALLANWEKFGQPPRHPKWRDVNLTAPVPGWARWSGANEILEQLAPAASAGTSAPDPTSSANFASFLGTHGANLNARQREELFRQYVEWQRQQQGRSSR
jgi:TRAP-type uncharacterized transport system substrate-binding protein